MVSKIRILTLGTMLLALAGCQTSGDLIRSTYYSHAYSRGDALLAANGQPIKINVITERNRVELEESIAESLNKYGPKWLVARYAPATKIDDNSPYQMKWAFNVPENGNPVALCRKDHTSQPESKSKTGVVLAAFCLHSKTLTSIRARLRSEPGSNAFAKSIGFIGRELLSLTNPERMDDCTNFDDCS